MVVSHKGRSVAYSTLVSCFSWKGVIRVYGSVRSAYQFVGRQMYRSIARSMG